VVRFLMTQHQRASHARGDSLRRRFRRRRHRAEHRRRRRKVVPFPFLFLSLKRKSVIPFWRREDKSEMMMESEDQKKREKTKNPKTEYV
jgi:hypothetical protein|tara:strand:- start:59 stop:325 length:267 start_codon:yes stop_codon:yes gene_type:complete